MKCLPSIDVYLVLGVWASVAGAEVVDYRSACKLVKCLEVEVLGWKEKSEREKLEWLEGFLGWLWGQGKELGVAWKYVTSYVYDRCVSEDVQNAVEAYKKYVKERFGKNVEVDLSDKKVLKAARVLSKIASEFGVSVYDVVRMQHECWEKIDRPLSFERMADEGVVRRRLQVKMDIDKKAGFVSKQRKEKESSEVKQLEKKVRECWNMIVSVGVMFFAGKKGWLGGIAKEVHDKLLSAKTHAERVRILRENSADRIVERWYQEGCPRDLL